MTRTLHRAACAVLATVMALALTACGGTSSKDPLTAAQEKAAQAESMDAQMEMAMSLEAAGERLDMNMTMNMSYFSKPERAKAEVVMDLGELGSQNITVYLDEKDGSHRMYLFDGTSWQSEAIDGEEMGAYSAKDSLDLYLNDGSEFQAVGDEQIDGKDTVKYTGVIKGEDVQEALESSGMLDSLGDLASMGVTEEEIEEMSSGLSDIPLSIWIDKKDTYPVKCEIDMTDAMNTILQKVMADLGQGLGGFEISVPNMTVTATYSNFNQATDFTIPAEALAAS